MWEFGRRHLDHYHLMHSEGNSVEVPSKYRQVMFWSLAAATLVIPAWIVCGNYFMGGAGGWGAFILMWTAAPVYLLYHLILFVVAFRTNKANHDSDISDYHLPRVTCNVLVAYYLCHFIWQLFMNDGGDQGPMGSIMMNHFGVSQSANELVFGIFMFAILGLSLLLAILICCVDTRAAQSFEQIPQEGGGHDEP